MHLIVPFAGVLSDAGRQALHALPLPRLDALLARLTPTAADTADEFSLSPPHERALAAALGWRRADGCQPWAARLAAGSAGALTGDLPWGLLTPVHLHLGTEQVTLFDPAALQLRLDESHELLDAIRPLFETEGFTLHAGADPLQWLATHELFDGLATASLDRVIGRNIDAWLPATTQARLLRRLQNEVQMLLYTHPLNEHREAAGALTINSFWLSGCGRAQPASSDEPTIEDRLRGLALSEDWTAWREAWTALDAGPIAALVDRPAPLQLTLCGERSAQRFELAARSLWQRATGALRRPDLHTMLETL